MTRPLHACLAAAMASFALGGAPALAQELAQDQDTLEIGRSAQTAHSGAFNGEEVRYDALVEESLLPGPDGAPGAGLVTTSYVRTDSGEPAGERPVLFLFNGGPGASTTPLHFGAFGPKRRVELDEGEQYIVDNPFSPLNDVDLVFIDPVGTGYSQPVEDGQAFWSRTGDAQSVARVIGSWLERHGRTDSPRYLLGQSYGTIRAAEIVRLAPELEFDGVLLFALVGGGRDELIGHVTDLPSMAATAWYHERAGRDRRPVEEVYADAVEFARTDYVTALMLGGALPEARREAMAERLSAMTGLEADAIAAQNLRISKRDFMFTLLEDEGLRTGRLDTRATARLDAPAQRPPYDDPGLSYVPAADIPDIACPATDCLQAPGEESIVDVYYQDVLGYDAPGDYNALNLEVNAAWDYEDRGDPIPALAEAMHARPDLRLFWAAGYFDLATTAYGGRFTLDQAGIPADRLTAAYFKSGHSVFVGEDNLEALSEAVRDFTAPSE